MRDKHKRANALPSPKLILAGGSSLAFGINSKMIQDSLHIPVANLGLHATLGIAFELAQAEMVAKKGDKVVWSFEYYVSDKEAIDGGNATKVLGYDAMPGIYDFLTPMGKLNFFQLKYLYLTGVNKEMHYIHQGETQAPRPLKWLSNIAVLLPGDVHSITVDSATDVYIRRSFDENGDIKSSLIEGHLKELGDNMKHNQGYKDEIEIINEYADRLKAKGVDVYYLFPPFDVSQREKDGTMLDTIEAEYRKGLHIPILNSVDDAYYPDSLFYNTVYHLNATGRQQNTLKLIADLKPVIKNPK